MKWTSAGIGAFGLLAQLTGLVVCMVGEVTYDGNPIQRFLVDLVEHMWAFLPAIALIGIVFALRLVRQKGSLVAVTVGLLLNLLWLTSGAAIWWFMYSRSQTA